MNRSARIGTVIPIIAGAALGSLLATAPIANARPVNSTPTALTHRLCGPSQFAVSWTGADPSVVSLAYRTPEGGTANLFTVSLSRTQKSTDMLIVAMSADLKSRVKAIQKTPDNKVWSWAATTSSGTVTTGPFACDYSDPDVIIVPA